MELYTINGAQINARYVLPVCGQRVLDTRSRDFLQETVTRHAPSCAPIYAMHPSHTFCRRDARMTRIVRRGHVFYSDIQFFVFTYVLHDAPRIEDCKSAAGSCLKPLFVKYFSDLHKPRIYSQTFWQDVDGEIFLGRLDPKCVFVRYAIPKSWDDSIELKSRGG